MSVDRKVSDAFREALDLPPDTDVTSMAYRGHPNWSSLGHMTLIAALEDKFDTMIDANDILEMSDYAKVVAIMSKYDG